jgi:RNA polymerase sigma factor (sigma-70 family)
MRPRALELMMDAMALPPFENFYVEHREPVLRHLRRLLGTQAAEDAFQETFLRALRAYASLRHADNLRGWVLTIATRVAVDESRRKRPIAVADVPDLESVDEPLPREELRRLTADLPPTERAAVFLRYGYDLGYDEIAAALGSSPDAARQATSSGVRRLRRKESL